MKQSKMKESTSSQQRLQGYEKEIQRLQDQLREKEQQAEKARI